MKTILTIILFSIFQVAIAQVQFGVTGTSTTPNRTLVTIEAKNEFDQGIENARVWVFALDAEGKVVGQRAVWLKPIHDERLLIEVANPATPESEERRSFNVVVDTQSEAVSHKMTFSRIIMEDGSLANVHCNAAKFKKRVIGK